MYLHHAISTKHYLSKEGCTALPIFSTYSKISGFLHFNINFFEKWNKMASTELHLFGVDELRILKESTSKSFLRLKFLSPSLGVDGLIWNRFYLFIYFYYYNIKDKHVINTWNTHYSPTNIARKQKAQYTYNWNLRRSFLTSRYCSKFFDKGMNYFWIQIVRIVSENEKVRLTRLWVPNFVVGFFDAGCNELIEFPTRACPNTILSTLATLSPLNDG